MLIDFHTHCFPDKLASRAIEKLSFVSGGIEPNTDGTVSGLRDSMKNGGVNKSVVLNIATNARQQKNVNDFTASINSDDLIAFGSVHHESPDALEELERIKAMGLKGVKLHPDYQGFEIDDPKMKPIYKKISQLGLITVFHAGKDYGYAPPYGNTPEKLLKALSWFSAPIVAAHWGGGDLYEDVIKLLCGTDIYIDTSLGYSRMPKYFAQKIYEKHGADKMLFGTDSPWHTPQMELRLINSLEISDDDKEKIFHKNAEKLLNL